jgi:superfamily I DNA/RNA helicase
MAKMIPNDVTEIEFHKSYGEVNVYSALEKLPSDYFFSSARKFKGLESDAIIVVDVDEKTFISDEARRVFYVATSRAKHFLDILSVLDNEQTGLIGEILEGQRRKNAKIQIGSHLKVKISV